MLRDGGQFRLQDSFSRKITGHRKASNAENSSARPPGNNHRLPQLSIAVQSCTPLPGISPYGNSGESLSKCRTRRKHLLISINEAQQNILVHVSPLETEKVFQGLNRVTPEDHIAPWDIPTTDNSAMDGFAFSHATIEEGAHEAFALSCFCTAVHRLCGIGRSPWRDLIVSHFIAHGQRGGSYHTLGHVRLEGSPRLHRNRASGGHLCRDDYRQTEDGKIRSGLCLGDASRQHGNCRTALVREIC